MMLKRLILVIALFTIMIAQSSCGALKISSEELEVPVLLSRQFGLPIAPGDNIELYEAASTWLGTPHRYGGNSKKGIDCSGFVWVIFKEVYGLSLASSSQGMLSSNCKMIAKTDLQEGDLVFFKTGRRKGRTTNHVGIYLKDGKFVHTSTSNGVVVSSLDDPYYSRTWVAGGRVDL
ncbi:C40 family peptidase [Parabacteroides sp. Marseille-P3160]|uniref:C40 family peptidase n=1 Tax=Parabacteroides sp. Marseille-P3160 TaxID=1917887 RepID=UPI0009BA5D8C|nr:C40 family peptidase [Parabacteroides sp. Marseille-P3160]